MSVLPIEARQVPARNGGLWIAQGFRLFRKAPAVWLALIFIYLLISMGLSLFKLIGPIVLNLLAPVFVAGFMLGCRALDQDEELEINHLFAGFRLQAAPLVTVGGLYWPVLLSSSGSCSSAATAACCRPCSRAKH